MFVHPQRPAQVAGAKQASIPDKNSMLWRAKLTKQLPPRTVLDMTQGQRLQALERQRRALELRRAGFDYELIAEAVGYSHPQSASRAVKAAMERIPQEATEDFRVVQMERLNFMLLKLWPGIQRGNRRDIEVGLQVIDKMDRLKGTDAAQEVQHHHDGAVLVVAGATEDYVAGLKKMAQQQGITPGSDVIDVEGDEVRELSPVPEEDWVDITEHVRSVEVIPGHMNGSNGHKKPRKRGGNIVDLPANGSVSPSKALKPCARSVRPHDPEKTACARCGWEKKDHAAW